MVKVKKNSRSKKLIRKKVPYFLHPRLIQLSLKPHSHVATKTFHCVHVHECVCATFIYSLLKCTICVQMLMDHFYLYNLSRGTDFCVCVCALQVRAFFVPGYHL